MCVITRSQSKGGAKYTVIICSKQQYYHYYETRIKQFRIHTHAHISAAHTHPSIKYAHLSMQFTNSLENRDLSEIKNANSGQATAERQLSTASEARFLVRGSTEGIRKT